MWVLGWSALIELTRGFLAQNHWVLDTSMFHQMASADCASAEGMPGVTVVVDGEFVGVTAADLATARRAVTRIVTAYECGAVVNPDTVISQIEGGTIMALGGAMFESVPLDHGQIARPSLSGYRVPRFTDIPAIEVVLLDRPDLPLAGAGETPLIAVAPAIAGAIFAATGRRLRTLPLVPEGRAS